jgi:hypothetical protein
VEIFVGKLEQMYYAEKGRYILSDKERETFDNLYVEFKSCKDKFLIFDDDEHNRISCLSIDEMAEKYRNGNYSDPENLIENCLDFCLYSSIHVLRMFKNMELSDILNTFREKGLKI